MIDFLEATYTLEFWYDSSAKTGIKSRQPLSYFVFVASECHVNETFRLHFHNGQ